jgi:hypothetical protein
MRVIHERSLPEAKRALTRSLSVSLTQRVQSIRVTCDERFLFLCDSSVPIAVLGPLRLPRKRGTRYRPIRAAVASPCGSRPSPRRALAFALQDCWCVRRRDFCRHSEGCRRTSPNDDVIVGWRRSIGIRRCWDALRLAASPLAQGTIRLGPAVSRGSTDRTSMELDSACHERGLDENRGRVEWCGRGESNPHGIATASPSNWLICCAGAY